MRRLVKNKESFLLIVAHRLLIKRCRKQKRNAAKQSDQTGQVASVFQQLLNQAQGWLAYNPNRYDRLKQHEARR